MITFEKTNFVRRLSNFPTFYNNFSPCYLIIIVIVTLVSFSAGERRQFDLSPDIPSHLPAPPKAEPPPDQPPNGGGAGNGAQTGNLGGGPQGGNFGGNVPLGFSASNPPIPPPQNVPVGPGVGPLGPGALPEDFVPFGLNHIILIIVPKFKAKFRKLPDWLESNVKVAMPITVFFDKLELGPNFPPGLLPPGAIPPPGQGQPGAIPAGPLNTSQPFLPGSTGQYYYPGVYPYYYQEGDDEDDDADDETETDDSDPYDHDNYYAEDRHKTWRIKRNIDELEFTLRKNRMKRSAPFNKTVHAADRAALLPRLENILESMELGGKSCLLRAICEVHEEPLHDYGLFGEFITMFFSVSRSAYAETHLPEYLRAERIGKLGDCSEYYKDCDKSMFSWEEAVPYSDLENNIPDDYEFVL